MPEIRAESSRVIAAPAATLYAIIADFRDGHRRILPPQFQDLEVESGGVGEGTVIRFHFRAMGMNRLLRSRVTEPEPGRVLAEIDDATGRVTTFTVDALAGDSARATIATTYTATGLSGWVERLIVPSLLERMYVQELANLEQVAREQTHS